ncbi:MAG: hypothetical protein A2Z20_09725 [Bdellovibrionales bacterium RBG_16_40_8]|nr:MAG: hypothetical protein A2Z20_09725 [Bdellovibrionales bacterium RBG_16_40_8]
MEKQLVIKKGFEDILKKSSELMSMHGCSATSMRGLAKATNMSLAGLYHYFNSKQELIFIINHKGFSSLLALAKKIATDKDPKNDRLYRAIQSHIKFFCKNRADMKVMMFGAHEMNKEHTERIRDLKESYRKLFNKMVAEFIEKNTGISLGQIELERKTFLLFGMMNWTFGWYCAKKHGTEDKLINDIYNTFTAGVLGGGSTNGATKNSRKMHRFVSRS